MDDSQYSFFIYFSGQARLVEKVYKLGDSSNTIIVLDDLPTPRLICHRL